MSTQTLTFSTHRGGTTESRPIVLRSTVIAGWTGRDPVARDRHIAELEALGVARPASTPIYYRVSTSRITVAPEIEVTGGNSSGEAEFVLIRDAGTLWLGAGSDHTDRKLETINVTLSKQVCDKPVAPDLWAFEDVRDHWDALLLRAWIVEQGESRLYQEGPVVTMLPPEEIIRGFSDRGLPEGTMMFCGTLAAKGGIRPSEKFSFELFDPVRQRRIAHSYDIRTLPVAG